MNISCVIVDDDEMSRAMLTQLIGKAEGWSCAAVCSSAIEARDFLQRNKVDVLFLDIEMPELGGLDLLRILKEKPEVVIVSAKEKYALDAFDYEVADFLLKPVSLDRFLKCVSRIESRIHSDEDAVEEGDDSVFVKANNQILRVKLSDIQWIEAFGDYVNIYTLSDRLVIHGTMKGIEAKLPAQQFLRVHRSYIVRLDKITGMEDTLVLIGKKLIPVGDSYRSDLMSRLKFL
ncbi:MAG: LytTR family DNA-binding domain-containing protein [Cyclobacteriaceae bacterium]|nr:LytTR family DNA-binding domain-containing protein [Cyclobacteriaceae bacterium]